MILALPLPARAAEGNPGIDWADTFFRYTGTENKAFFSELPGETVDPFTGTLHVIQEDLSLPGKAGLDLRVVRSYTSRIWGRADLLDVEPLTAERDSSILGYGWSLHFGRLRAPRASGDSGLCGGHFPIFQEPDGTSHVFYPAFEQGSGVFVSKEHWRLEQDCSVRPGMVCVWSDTGLRYEFAPTSIDWQGSTRTNQFWIGATPFAPVTAVVDSHGNRIAFTYLNSSGAPDYVVDTYGRTISFAYVQDVDGRRLESLQFNGKSFMYAYETVRPEQVSGHPGRFVLPGARRFLAAVTPPAGPSTFYEYAHDVPVANNQYALSSITYPGGGTVSYAYDALPFFTGVATIPFAVVTRRVVAGRAVTPGEWSYSYSSPAYGTSSSIHPRTGEPTDLHVTTVTRPDGRQDTYTMYGFGWAANKNAYGYTYAVGLTEEIARADRSEVESFQWNGRFATPISTAVYSAPIYGSTCEAHFIADGAVYAPVVERHWIERGGALYETAYSEFDTYGQAKRVAETGYLGGMDAVPPPAVRVTTTSFFHAPVDAGGARLNLLRGRPEARTVCVGADCFVDSWSYDEPGYPTHSRAESGVTVTFDHAADGNLSRVTDALGHHVDLRDYSNGVPLTAIFNDTFRTTRTVTWEGWIESETNRRGYTTTTLRDAIGRPVEVRPAGANDVTEYSYAPDGSWVTATRAGSRAYQKTIYSDGLGRIVSTVDTQGVRTSTRYDGMGRAWFKSYPYDSAGGEVGDKLDRDGLGRVLLKTRAYRPAADACDRRGACTVTTRYVANCVRTDVYRAVLDFTRTWSCDTSFGDPGETRLTQVADPFSLWQYGHSAAGNLTSISAPLAQGNRAFQYDARQFLIWETAPETGPIEYGRNAIGQITTRRDARGVTATYHYDDPLGRLRRITYSRSSADDVTLGYDENGNVTEASSANGGSFEYRRDELDRVSSQRWTFAGRTHQTSYHRDSSGCLDEIIYPTGTRVTMTCDLANRVTGISVDGADLVTGITYHPGGAVAGMSYANGIATTIDLDWRGRVTAVTSPGVLDLKYGYDGADNVTSLEDGTRPGSLRTMSYDEQNRLQFATTADGLWGFAQYDYDELGNRVLKIGADVTQASYDSANRLAWASSPWTRPPLKLTWDDAGRLASSSDGTAYRYDASGRRVLKAEPGRTIVYHYDAAGLLIAETSPDGTKLRDYYYLGNKLVAVDGCMGDEVPPCTGRQWYHTDTLGSAVVRTDESGSVVAHIDYDPWGGAWAQTGVPGDRQYNGRVYDAGTGFHDYGARLYWPEIGRFISPDQTLGDVSVPASLNRYSYVHNNPYKYVDPDGHQAAPANRLARPPSQVDWAARGRVVREAIAEGRIEARGQAHDTMGPAGEPPPEAAVRQAERIADAVDPPQQIINPATGLPVGMAGIYEFPDATAGGVPYVGQSGNIPRRLAQHEAAGRLGGPPAARSVQGGKTAREIAEHNRIQEITGGVPARQSPNVSNKVDPIGPNRQHLLKNGSGG